MRGSHRFTKIMHTNMIPKIPKYFQYEFFDRTLIKNSYMIYLPYYCFNHISYVYLSSVIGYKSLFMRGLAKGGYRYYKKKETK